MDECVTPSHLFVLVQVKVSSSREGPSHSATILLAALALEADKERVHFDGISVFRVNLDRRERHLPLRVVHARLALVWLGFRKERILSIKGQRLGNVVQIL